MALPRLSRGVAVVCVLAVGSWVPLIASDPPPAAADDGGVIDEQPGGRFVVTGLEHTCVITAASDLLCVGGNSRGQLGTGDTDSVGSTPGSTAAATPVSLGTGRKVAAVTAGDRHTCALLDNSSIKCWGDNQYGQLGYGDTSNRGDQAGEMGSSLPAVALGAGRRPIAVSAGSQHTCALFDSGSIACWGRGAQGRLGTGATSSIGDGPGEMGDALRTVPLGRGRSATAVSGGGLTTCALLDRGDVKCWGYGATGSLGQESLETLGNEPGELGDALRPIKLGRGRSALAISAGYAHVCAVLDDTTLRCWGTSENGALGADNLATTIGATPSSMGDNLRAVPLGTGGGVSGVDVGYDHTCVTFRTTGVACWGANAQGQLGYGDTDDRGDAFDEIPSLQAVDLGAATGLGVSAGHLHTCAALSTGRVSCWGYGGQGQLGTDDIETRGDEPGEMGADLVVADTTDLFPPVPAITIVTVRPVLNIGAVAEYYVYLMPPVTVPAASVRIESNVADCRRATFPETDGMPAYTCTRQLLPSDGAAFTAWFRAVGPNGVSDKDDVTTLINYPPQPDGLIRLGKGRFVGNDVYDYRLVAQGVVGAKPPGRTLRFTARMQNDSDETDRFVVKGQRSTAGVRLRYLSGRSDVTDRVVAGTWTTRSIEPGASRDLTVLATPTKRAVLGAPIVRTITIISRTDALRRDTIAIGVGRL
jgi:alpha-tubulin suppressor-like RCC1 family protein